MAKNDYFSILYKLLVTLYENLKDGEKTDLRAIIDDTEAFPINQAYWIAIFEDALEKKLIRGVSVISVANGGKRIQEQRDGIRITADGVDYLENNSNMKKAMEHIKDFIPMAAKVLLP